MAPAAHLSFPALADARPFIREASEGERVLARAALAAIEASLADAADWKGDPSGFLKVTLERWAGTLGHDQIIRRFGFHWSLSTAPESEIALTEDHYTDRLYLCFYPEPNGHHGFDLGPGLDRLHRIDERLPQLLWDQVAGSLGRMGMEVWDHKQALEQEIGGWWGEWVAERNEEIEDEVDRIPIPSEALPRYLVRPIPPMERAGLKTFLGREETREGSWAADLIRGALDLRAVADQVDIGFKRLDPEERGYFDDVMGQWPSVVTWIGEGDASAHLWDELGDSLWNGGGPFSPVSCWRMEISAAGIRSGYAHVERYYAALQKATAVLDLLHYPDGVPLIVSLAGGAS